MDDPTVGAEQLPGSGPVARDDPGARAAADVRAIFAKALGLRRIVELAAEFDAGAVDPAEPEPPRARFRRPGRPRTG